MHDTATDPLAPVTSKRDTMLRPAG
jgi:hypothetical protein